MKLISGVLYHDSIAVPGTNVFLSRILIAYIYPSTYRAMADRDIWQVIHATSLWKSSVNLLSPSAQGMYSVFTPCSGQFIRLG